MRVRFTQDYAAHIEGTYRVESFRKGQEADGPFAEQLLASGCPVEEIAEGPAVDLDGDGVPDGTAAQVLEWVGDDKDRATAALEAEEAKGDKARSTLVASLTKLAN